MGHNLKRCWVRHRFCKDEAGFTAKHRPGGFKPKGRANFYRANRIWRHRDGEKIEQRVYFNIIIGRNSNYCNIGCHSVSRVRPRP